MQVYRVDQIVEGKTYEGGTFRRLRHEAEKIAEARKRADEETGEYRTSYTITKVEI